jgi:hypothetical protein
MTVGTAVPPPVFGPTGFQSQPEQAILAGVQTDINTAFGGNLNPALNTPQGQLASSEAAIIGNAQDTFCFITTQFDPQFAQGRAQDALGFIYFLQRNPAQPTVVQALCTGLQGVVIPVGALALDINGNEYVATASGTIPVAGNITLPFACLTVGPIACPAGALSTIFRSIPGWDAITNEAAGVLGNNVESRSAFEARRAASVAQNSLGSLPSILGAVLSVPNVIDAFVTENDTGSPVTIGGVTLNPNSLYVGVAGGTAADIAEAIWLHKAPGCAYTGNTTVTVLDTSKGYVPPYPAYSVTYETVADLAILFQINLLDNGQVPANATTLVQNAIVSAFGGTDVVGQRPKIGTKLLASRFYPTIAALGPWAQIVDILIGSNNAPSVVFVGSISGSTLTVSSISSGAVAIGQTLFDTTGNILPGTMVTGGSGSTWTVSVAQTVVTEAMTAAQATLYDVAVSIAQIPVVSPQNILVSVVSG